MWCVLDASYSWQVLYLLLVAQMVRYWFGKDLNWIFFSLFEFKSNISTRDRNIPSPIQKCSGHHFVLKKTYFSLNLIIYSHILKNKPKNRFKYMTTLWNEYIDKFCNYTRKIKQRGLKYSQITYISYGAKSEIINSNYDIKIS